jgi:hypothetical protein
MRLHLLVLCGLFLAPAYGQTPPTATEAFKLRIQCKNMADEKAESLWQPNPYLKPQPEIILRYSNSKYDAKFNRCYIEIFDHHKAAGPHPLDLQIRQIYDAQKDDLLAFAKIENGTKVGMVFDHDNHQTTSDKTLGWDDANGYIDEMMAEIRK